MVSVPARSAGPRTIGAVENRAAGDVSSAGSAHRSTNARSQLLLIRLLLNHDCLWDTLVTEHGLEWRSPLVRHILRISSRPGATPSIGAAVRVRPGVAPGGILESFPLSLEIRYGEVKLLADEFLQAELAARNGVVQVSPIVIERVLAEEDVFLPQALRRACAPATLPMNCLNCSV